MSSKFRAALSLLALLLALPASAQNYVVEVHGIVCSFCSYGVAKKVSKLDFIDTAQYENGVKVDIEKQMVYVAVRDGAELDRQALFKAIESGGYQPVTIWSLDNNGQREALKP